MRTPPLSWSALFLSLLAGCGGAQKTASEQPDKAMPPPAGVGLQAAVLVERRAAGAPRIDALQEGEALENGDGLRLALDLARPAHVLAVYLDGRGQASLLFPSPAIPLANPLPAGQALDIPLAGSWFTLEGPPGQEAIYLLASLAPFADPAGLLERLAALGPGWTPALADEVLAQHLTRGGVYRTPDGRRVKEEEGEGEERLARTGPGLAGDPDAPPAADAPPSDPDRPRPFRRPMLIAGVVRGANAGCELRQVLERDGVEVRAVSFQHR